MPFEKKGMMILMVIICQKKRRLFFLLLNEGCLGTLSRYAHSTIRLGWNDTKMNFAESGNEKKNLANEILTTMQRNFRTTEHLAVDTTESTDNKKVLLVITKESSDLNNRKKLFYYVYPKIRFHIIPCRRFLND